MKQKALVVGGVVVLGVALGCGAGERTNSEPDRVSPPAVSTTAAIKWDDVTAKYRKASMGNVTIKGNPQWEPIVKHVVKVQYDKSDNGYRVHMDLPSDDLRRQLPGIMMTPGVAGCMTIQFWDNKPNGITVYGNDGKKATEATGSPGVCQDL